MSNPAHERVISVTGDVVSAGAIVGALMGLLPALAGVAAIIWYAIQIWESKTVQKHVRLWRAKRRVARRAAIAFELGQLKQDSNGDLNF